MNFKDIEAGAQRGITAMQIALGNAYLKGKDWEGSPVPMDHVAAKQWLEQAASKGASTAIFMLGTIYEDGLGVDVDLDKAIELFKDAARRGAFLPCLHLARIYAHENSKHYSPEAARRWYEKALSFEGGVDDFEGIEEAKAYLS